MNFKKGFKFFKKKKSYYKNQTKTKTINLFNKLFKIKNIKVLKMLYRIQKIK